MKRGSISALVACALIVGMVSSPPVVAKGKKTSKPCSKYVPGELGQSADTIVVTDRATSGRPIVIRVQTAAGTPAAESSVFKNIQIDTSKAKVGLYVRWTFEPVYDYDLYLTTSDGSVVARSAGSAVPGSDTGMGGHQELGVEQLTGIETADCVGYTLEVRTYVAAEDFAYPLEIWLGKATYEP